MDGISAVVNGSKSPQGAAVGALRLMVSWVAVTLAAAGCRPAAPPLSRLAASPDVLGRQVLAARAARDETRLVALALTREEFEARVWPELPASRPERNLTAEYVWTSLKAKSDGGLRQVVATLGGERLDLVRIEFDGPSTDYTTYSVSREAVLVVADAEGGERRVRAFGSVIHADGGVKVFSYVVD